MVRAERDLTEPKDFDRLLDELDGMIAATGETVGCEIVNHFTPGQYVRECRMKAGTLGTSMVHKFEHVFIIASGVVTVRDDEGIRHLCAPFVGITKPGTRRALYAHNDVVWITSHPNPDECRDVAEIVRRLTDEPEGSPVPPALANQWRFETPTPAIAS